MTTLHPVTQQAGPFERFNDWMEDLFEGRNLAHQWWPRADVCEKKGEIEIALDLPGMTMEDIDVQLANDTLTIRGKREFRNEVKKEDFVRVERQYGDFMRSFRVPSLTDPKKVKALYRNGILTVTVPRPEESKTHKVAIESK